VVGDILLDVVVRLDGLIQPDTDTYGHAVVGVRPSGPKLSALFRQRYAFSLKPRTTDAGASRHPLSEPELSLPSCHCAIGDQAPDHNSQE
jgi:hypothetical protein